MYIVAVKMLITAVILHILADYWPIILLGLVTIVFLVLLCCSLYQKKKKVIGIYATAIVVCIIGTVIWCVLFPTAYPYVDLWVLGKTEEQIKEVYGEPDYDTWEAHGHNEMAYYTRYIFLDPEYYVITFDEEGKAIDVREDLFVPLGG